MTRDDLRWCRLTREALLFVPKVEGEAKMAEEEFTIGDYVYNRETKKSGWVTHDIYATCPPGKVAVTYDDEEGYTGTDPRVLSKMRPD